MDRGHTLDSTVYKVIKETVINITLESNSVDYMCIQIPEKHSNSEVTLYYKWTKDRNSVLFPAIFQIPNWLMKSDLKPHTVE